MAPPAPAGRAAARSSGSLHRPEPEWSPPRALGEPCLDDLFQGSVIVGGEAAGDGGADVVVVPDGCGEGQDALPDADADSLGVCPPCCSRSSWPLKVSLIDSITCRRGLKNCVPGRSGSPLRAGRSKVIPASARAASNSWP